ncbi:MAG: hypothetical protein GW809_00080 [Bacteroidetes bacterium]|nr:hypothetical protein [Bacteroidota bacterium]
MIKFFLKIRKKFIEQNKVRNPTFAKATAGKYFFYAIGEILLVVIGILKSCLVRDNILVNCMHTKSKPHAFRHEIQQQTK